MPTNRICANISSQAVKVRLVVMWPQGVVVAVTKPSVSSCALSSLSLAAMALPGLLMQPALADDAESLHITYQHYEEGARDIGGLKSKFDPIQVDTLLANINFSITDELAASLTVTQDTWSGATPVATAPSSLRGNRIMQNHVMTGASIDGGHHHGGDDDDAETPSTHTTTGASPYLYGALKLDAQKRPLQTDDKGKVIGGLDKKLVHTLSSASPEVRQQVDLTLNQQIENGKWTYGGGLSQERDFDSYFSHVARAWDFNKKQTSLSAGISYAFNKTHALLDHDVVPHIYEPYMFIYEKRGNTAYNDSHKTSQFHLGKLAPRLTGTRDDWGLNLGVSHALNPSALLEVGLGFAHSYGYQSNPYKAVEVGFIDPRKQLGQAGGNAAANYMYDAEVVGVLEQRPDLRNQSTLSARYVQYIAATDAALHTNYRFYHDTWGLNAHTLDLEWIQPVGNWTITPHLRYYTQNKADFYVPYLLTDQGLFTPVTNSKDTIPFDRKKLPDFYSSDPRLSGYGTLTEGITVSKDLFKELQLDISVEFMQRAGKLQWGVGNNDGSSFAYADYNSYLASIGISMPLGGKPKKELVSHDEHTEHHHTSHQSHQHLASPAGVQLDHRLNADDIMVGYRTMMSESAGNIEINGKTLDDYSLINKACYGHPCYMRPTRMTMRMQMLDIMYAPTDWLTLMIMPQFVDMKMSSRSLDGSPRTGGMDAVGMAITHAEHPHVSSGVGDTEVHGLIQLFKDEQSEIHLGMGFSAPTGKSNLTMRPMMGNPAAYMDYGMQLGSGTWDFKPSITYRGWQNKLSWGAQINSTQRLEKANASGYALGNQLQATAWGGYQFINTTAFTLRGLYTEQDKISGGYTGAYVPISSVDYTQNYGGQFMDIGLGFTGTVTLGALAGSHWGIEWLKPVKDSPNGYQLKHKGNLVLNWSISL